MKISIVIPIYNAENYLRRSLDSVVNQSYRNLEIILINDGSTDRSGEICEAYAQKDNRIIVLQNAHKGVSEARNSGIAEITGDYLYFLDADDFIDSQTIFVLQKRAKETNADVIIGNFYTIYENGKITKRSAFKKDSLSKVDLAKSAEKFKYFFWKHYGKEVCNRLYKTEVLQLTNIFFDDFEKIYPEDMLFNLKLYVHLAKVELVNDYFYYYLQRSNSIVYSTKDNLTEKFINLIEVYYAFLTEKNMVTNNKDLLAYLVFSLIDGSQLYQYRYSKNKYRNMREELTNFKASVLCSSLIQNLARGRYLEDIPYKIWKYYAFLFSFLYDLKLFSLLTLLQFIRFKIQHDILGRNNIVTKNGI